MNSEIKSIKITADLLRSISDPQSQVNTSANLNSLYCAIEWQLRTATGLEVSKVDYGNFDPQEFIKLLNLDAEADRAWHDSYWLSEGEIPPDAIDYIRERFEYSVPICFEASNLMKNAFRALKINYIDITTHPIRFLDDNMLGIRTNAESVFKQLSNYHHDENDFYVQAGMLKAHMVRKQMTHIAPGSALIAGQTDQDISLLTPSGQLLSLFDYKEEIEQVCQQYTSVYFKPHPYMRKAGELQDFMSGIGNIQILNENFYSLMANENISKIYAISSGVLNEAPYWGKEAEAFYKKYINTYQPESKFNDNEFFAIYDDYLNPKFWADILSSLIDVNEGCPDVAVTPKANRSRLSLNAFWGYDKIHDDYVRKKGSKKQKNKVSRYKFLHCLFPKSLNSL